MRPLGWSLHSTEEPGGCHYGKQHNGNLDLPHCSLASGYVLARSLGSESSTGCGDMSPIPAPQGRWARCAASGSPSGAAPPPSDPGGPEAHPKCFCQHDCRQQPLLRRSMGPSSSVRLARGHWVGGSRDGSRDAAHQPRLRHALRWTTVPLPGPACAGVPASRGAEAA
jgi:hypothetical protein